MLKEALLELVGMANKAAQPRLLPVPDDADPSKVFLHNPADGKITEIEVLPPSREHKVLTLESMAKAVRSYNHGPEADNTPAMWCSLKSITLIVDDCIHSFRRDTVTMVLTPSPIFDAVAGVSGRKQAQEVLYRFLKHNLHNSDISPGSFISLISNLKFSSSQEIAGQVSAVAKNTFGRSTMSEVTGAAELPETIAIEFAPWPNSRIWEKNEGPTVTLTCSVYVDATEGTITLSLLPGEIEAAQADAIEDLCERVQEVTGVTSDRVFAGTP